VYEGRSRLLEVEDGVYRLDVDAEVPLPAVLVYLLPVYVPVLALTVELLVDAEVLV
jgi:hypothetical protein